MNREDPQIQRQLLQRSSAHWGQRQPIVRGSTAILVSGALEWSNEVVGGQRNSRRSSFIVDLIAQLFSSRSRITPGRYAAYNGWLGLVLLTTALALWLSQPQRLGLSGVGLLVASAVLLLAVMVVPASHPRHSQLLRLHGLVIFALSFGFALECATWALNAAPGAPLSSFRYLPGVIVAGATYGATLWADFGPGRKRSRAWRLTGFAIGVVLELVVLVLVVPVALRY